MSHSLTSPQKSRSWLLFDANYLIYRAYYTTGHLSHGEDSTGVIYGFLRDIQTYSDRFNTEQCVFCFDHGENLRKKIYPNYKTGRTAGKTKEELKALESMQEEVEKLKLKILPKLYGHRCNVFYQEGYEADDLIAEICWNSLPALDDAIILSGDKDMYQLLSEDKVIVCHPRGNIAWTEESFTNLYEISPSAWIEVKACAGCSSDNIKGIKGIGEATAIKYLNGSLKKDSKGEAAILNFRKTKDYHRNRELIMLPLAGTKAITLQDCEMDEKARKEILTKYGMKSLMRSK